MRKSVFRYGDRLTVIRKVNIDYDTRGSFETCRARPPPLDNRISNSVGRQMRK